MSAPAWTAYDEGYLQAYQWSGALAGGAALPQETTAAQLGPGEVAHGHFAVGVYGFFGEAKEYNRSFFLVGGPVGLALTGAASMARNASKKAEAERAAAPRWHGLGTAEITVTNQRLLANANGQSASFWHAENGPLELTVGPNGAPSVQFQPSGQPVLRLDSPWAPVLYVFAHQAVNGRPPGVPMPAGVLERAQQEGRLR